jgi:hypothetical protein
MAALPPWSNQDLVLFHGTTLPAGESILADGVLLDRAERRADFGRGFYTTTDLRQASNFARRISEPRCMPGSIVQFSLERNLLSELAALAFVRGGLDALDYWSMVRHCRAGNGGHARLAGVKAFYDVVFGPVARN